MKSNEQFWYFLIQGKLDNNTGAYGNFYSYGEHCGDSLAKSMEIAKSEGFSNPKLIETARLDVLDEFELPEDTIEKELSTYTSTTFYSYDIENEEYDFIPPIGIAFGTDEHDFETSEITDSLVAYAKNEDGFFELNLVVNESKINVTFLQLIESLGNYSSVKILIKDHWEDSINELWIQNITNDKSKIFDFVLNNKASTINNGYIDIIINSENDSSICLDEHKKLIFMTKDETEFKNIIDLLSESGFQQTKEFKCIEFGFHHWHYRPSDSLNLLEFKEFLIEEGFKVLKLSE